MKNLISLKLLLGIIFLIYHHQTHAFNLKINSTSTIKGLRVFEHLSTNGTSCLAPGSTEIHLKNYPNTLYINNHKSPSKTEFLGFIWVDSDESVIEINIDNEQNITYKNLTNEQKTANEVFIKSKHKWRDFPCTIDSETAIAPLLTLEASAIIQNLHCFASRDYLSKLLTLSQEQGIENWAQKAISLYITNEPESIYSNNKLLRFMGFNMNDEMVNFNPNNTNYYLVTFSASWCGPCIKGIPKIRAFNDEFADQITLITLWNDPNLKTFVHNHADVKSKINWTSLWDKYGVMAESLSIRFFPTYILFSPDGTELKRWEGNFPKKIDLSDYNN